MVRKVATAVVAVDTATAMATVEAEAVTAAMAMAAVEVEVAVAVAGVADGAHQAPAPMGRPEPKVNRVARSSTKRAIPYRSNSPSAAKLLRKGFRATITRTRLPSNRF